MKILAQLFGSTFYYKIFCDCGLWISVQSSKYIPEIIRRSCIPKNIKVNVKTKSVSEFVINDLLGNVTAIVAKIYIDRIRNVVVGIWINHAAKSGYIGDIGAVTVVVSAAWRNPRIIVTYLDHVPSSRDNINSLKNKVSTQFAVISSDGGIHFSCQFLLNRIASSRNIHKDMLARGIRPSPSTRRATVGKVTIGTLPITIGSLDSSNNLCIGKRIPLTDRWRRTGSGIAVTTLTIAASAACTQRQSKNSNQYFLRIFHFYI